MGLIAIGASATHARDEKPVGTVVTLKNLEGVWRSRGYGWIWSFRKGKVDRYDQSGSVCIKSRVADLDPTDPGVVFRISDDGRYMTAVVDHHQGSYYYAFDLIDQLPPHCSERQNSHAAFVLEATIQIFSSHYAFFEARKIDWSKAILKARARVTPKTNKRELFKILTGLLSHFPDSHVSLTASIAGVEVTYEPSDEPHYKKRRNTVIEAAATPNATVHWNSAAARKLLRQSHTAANGEIVYGLFADVGYLRIDSMDGYSIADADRALNKAIALFKDTKALIIDVTMNDGGEDAIARRIAGFFADDERTVAYSKRPGDAGIEEAPLQTITVEPNGKVRYSRPIYLITSRETVSAGEIFVLAMRGLPQVTHVGEVTDGSMSDILTKTLPNGWTLTLSNEIYLDSQGVSWEGRGVPPEIAIDIKNDAKPTNRDVDAAREVIAHLLSSRR